MSPEMWSGLVGLFMPCVVEVIKKLFPDKRWVNYSLALGVSCIVGGLSSWFGGEFNPESILASVGTALIASQAVYNYWFRGSRSEKWIIKRFLRRKRK